MAKASLKAQKDKPKAEIPGAKSVVLQAADREHAAHSHFSRQISLTAILIGLTVVLLTLANWNFFHAAKNPVLLETMGGLSSYGKLLMLNCFAAATGVGAAYHARRSYIAHHDWQYKKQAYEMTKEKAREEKAATGRTVITTSGVTQKSVPNIGEIVVPRPQSIPGKTVEMLMFNVLRLRHLVRE